MTDLKVETLRKQILKQDDLFIRSAKKRYIDALEIGVIKELHPLDMFSSDEGEWSLVRTVPGARSMCEKGDEDEFVFRVESKRQGVFPPHRHSGWVQIVDVMEGWVSFLVKENGIIEEVECPSEHRIVIDCGRPHMAVWSSGTKIINTFNRCR